MKHKLELFIQEVFDGAKVIYPEKGSRGDIVDLRPVVKVIVKSGEKFTMIKHVSDGVYFITGFSTSGSRQDDYLAGWVFIPLALVRVLNDNLVEIGTKIQNILEKLTDDNREQFMEECNNISLSFKEYKDPIVPLNIRQIVSSIEEKKYAVRYHKKGELASLLSNIHLLQPAYYKYQGVVLIEEGHDCRLAEVKDKLHRTVTLRIEQNFPKDVAVSVELDGNECTLEQGKEYLCHENDILNLTFMKNGMAPSKSIIEVKKEDISVGNDKLDWKIAINKNKFVITDATDGSIIDNFTITLPDTRGKKPLDNNNYEIIASQTSNLHIRVDATDFDTYDKIINIVDQEIINIELKPTTKSYKFILPTTHDPQEITLKLRVREKPKSPVIGYKAVGSYHDSYNLVPTFNVKRPFSLILISLVIGIAIGIGIMVFKDLINRACEPNDNNNTRTEVIQPIDTTQKNTSDNVTNGEESHQQDTVTISENDRIATGLTNQGKVTNTNNGKKQKGMNNGGKPSDKGNNSNGNGSISNGNGGNPSDKGSISNGNGSNSNGNGRNPSDKGSNSNGNGGNPSDKGSNSNGNGGNPSDKGSNSKTGNDGNNRSATTADKAIVDNK